jgi:Uma2 family endonuclease
MNTARKLHAPATFADDLASAPEDARLEIIGGEVFEKETASFEHGDCQLALGEGLRVRFRRGDDGHPGWWFASEVLIELFPDEIYIPDVAGWRRDRHPERPSGRPVRARPDWICEILSPSTARRDLGEKRAAYAAAGVEFLWFINLEHRTLTALRLGEQGYVLVQAVGPEPAARVPPFEHADLDVGLFFGVEPGEAG